MITMQDALDAHIGSEFHGLSADGRKIITVRVNGRCQTWRTRPAEFRLPIKYGMWEYGEITHNDTERWSLGPAPVVSRRS